MLKKIIALTVILFSVGSVHPLFAQQSGSSQTSYRNIRISYSKQSLGGRKKAPSRQRVFCYYEDGNLDMEFAYSEGECTLIVTNLASGAMRTYSFDSSEEASVFVGPLTSAKIEIITSTGNEYEGYLGPEDYNV